MDHKPHIVVIGGGTGAATILAALKSRPVNLAALISMADDGGSSGRLRDELGALPPGDIRQALVALSQGKQELVDLFNFRFPAGGSLEGHSFGNLFLSAGEMMNKNLNTSIQLAAELLNIKGKVLPTTLDDCRLIMESSGNTISGEHNIESFKIAPKSQPKLYLSPKANFAPGVIQELQGADLIIIAPGNLYGSLIPALLVDGMKEELSAAKAPVVFICNLVNRANHTLDFTVYDYVHELERFIGENVIEYVLYNTEEPAPDLLEKYALEDEFPVDFDPHIPPEAVFKAIGGQFLSKQHREQDISDTLLKRSLIRHDAEAVADAIMGQILHV
jgi:uncharacterized cofD-like protein